MIRRESFRWRAAFAAVVVLGLALRVALAIEARPQEISDAGDYRELAIGLIDSGEYGAIGNSGWNQGLPFRAYRPPGYPFIRAGLMLAFDRGPGPALWLNVICEGIALGFVLLTALHLLGRRAALVAAALFGTFVLFTASLMTESLSMALWAALAWSVATRAHVDRVRIGVVMGVIVGVAILVRPVSIFWVPVLAWPLLRATRRGQFRGLAAFVAPVVVLVGAWTVRNTMLFGSVVWISTNLGVHNAPDFGIPWARLSALRHEGLSEPAADRALTREIIAAAVADPTATRELYRTRMMDLFAVSPADCWELGFARDQVYRGSAFGLEVLDDAIALWRLLHVVGGLGIVRALLNKQAGSRVLIAPFVLFVLLQCVLSRGDVRLLAPAIPMLCVFAAQALKDPA